MMEYLFQGHPKRVIAAGPGNIEVILDGAGNAIAYYLRNFSDPLTPAEFVTVFSAMGHEIRQAVRVNLTEYYEGKYVMHDWAIYLHKICKPKNLQDFCKFLDKVIR